jgi:hypothetical protein
MIQDVKQEVVIEKIKNVMLAIFVKMSSLHYTPELIYIVAFFLCFAKEAHAYFIIVKLIEDIYP